MTGITGKLKDGKKRLSHKLSVPQWTAWHSSGRFVPDEGESTEGKELLSLLGNVMGAVPGFYKLDVLSLQYHLLWCHALHFTLHKHPSVHCDLTSPPPCSNTHLCHAMLVFKNSLSMENFSKLIATHSSFNIYSSGIIFSRKMSLICYLNLVASLGAVTKVLHNYIYIRILSISLSVTLHRLLASPVWVCSLITSNV